MRLSDDCDFDKKANAATDKLLELLSFHHDYSVPRPAITKTQARAIRREEAIQIKYCEKSEKIDVCVLPIDKPTLTVSAIQRVVCQHYGVSHSDLISPRRDKRICDPRMIAMFLAREMTAHGLPSLGKFFHRDHTSVLHAIRKIDGLVKKGHPLASHVQNLREILTA